MKIDPFSKYFLKVIKFDDVNKYKFDQILNLQNYNFPKSYLGLLKKHSSKIYSISYASLLLNTKLWKYFNYYPKYYLSSRHELQRTFDIFGIKCNFNKDKFIPKINYKFKSKTKFDIAIVVFSEKSTKHWNFKNMSKFIFKNKNNKIVLLGGSDASPVANRLLKSFKLVNYVGKTNFRKLIDIVYNSKMIVTPDTGTAHLAAALNKKTIVLYGPTELGRWKPLGKKVTQMYKKDVCRCCGDTNHCKIKTHECMNIDIKKYF